MVSIDYIGFDIDKKTISFCAKAQDGNIQDEGSHPGAARQTLTWAQARHALALNLAFETHAASCLHEPFVASAMSDAGTFVVRNSLEATFEILVRMPIAALVLRSPAAFRRLDHGAIAKVLGLGRVIRALCLRGRCSRFVVRRLAGARCPTAVCNGRSAGCQYHNLFGPFYYLKIQLEGGWGHG